MKKLFVVCFVSLMLMPLMSLPLSAQGSKLQAIQGIWRIDVQELNKMIERNTKKSKNKDAFQEVKESLILNLFVLNAEIEFIDNSFLFNMLGLSVGVMGELKEDKDILYLKPKNEDKWRVVDIIDSDTIRLENEGESITLKRKKR